VTKNVTHDLQVSPCVDLPCSVTVSEGMRADYFRGNPGSARVVANAMPESSAGEWVVRHVRSQEDPPPLRMGWALGMEVGGKAPIDRSYQ
jgi:hypothetical protein